MYILPASPEELADKSQHNRQQTHRFTRAWHAAHPDGSREELIKAWQDYRSRPVDERGRV